MRQGKLKFLVDVGVGKKVEEWLLKNGYDTKAVRDLNPGMQDEEIITTAVSEGRMIITMDKGFGDLVYQSGWPHAGVLLLRLEEAKADEKVRVVANILEKYSDQLANHYCVFRKGRLRIRR